MGIDSYLVFVSIAFLYILTPGPAVFLAINYGVNFGLRKTVFLFMGNSSGLGILAFISAIGLGSLIVTVPLLNNVFRISGAIVLAYLGIKMIISSKNIVINKTIDGTIKHKTNFDFYKEGLLLALTNPKSIVFFMSIYPQFINFENNPYIQFIILGSSFMVLSFLELNGCSLLSRFLFGNLLTEKRAAIFNYISGLILVLIGIIFVIQTYYYDMG